MRSWPWKLRASHAAPAPRGLASLCLACLLGFSQVATVRAEVLTIGGTGAALGGMQLLGDAFETERRDVDVRVLPSLGSSGGIRALLDRKIDLAVFSRPLKEDEKAGGVQEVLYARTLVVLAGHGDVPVNELNEADLVDILTGDLLDWPDGARVRLIMRSPEETDIKLARGVSKGVDQALDRAYERPGVMIALNDQENCHFLETLPGALGFASLAQIHAEGRRVKVLSFDGKPLDADEAGQGGYPMSKPLFLGEPNPSSPLASAFIEFVLSDAGRRILADHGHHPVSAAKER